jgi:hypothetical protein
MSEVDEYISDVMKIGIDENDVIILCSAKNTTAVVREEIRARLNEIGIDNPVLLL